MKYLLFLTALTMILLSCKKEIISEQNSDTLLTVIKAQLKDSMAENDFQQLDFDHTTIINYKEHGFSMLRIPFSNKNIETDFVVLKIASDQKLLNGRMVHISKNQEAVMPKPRLRFNGKLFIYSLKRNLLTESLIEDGYITAFHSNRNNPIAVVEVVEVPYTTLPDVVVVATYQSGSNCWGYSNWFNFTSFFYQGDQGGGDGGYYYGLSGGGGGGGELPVKQEPILIDYEPVETLPAIDLKKYLNCFNSIPDAGATCTIKILTDIPVDKDPNAFFDWNNNSPGHTFLQLTKKNGSQIIQQNIGFYPMVDWKNILTNAPVNGKFVDNNLHEFNASFSMDLTSEKFNSTLTHILYLANFITYDIDGYNCTDFALEVFNYNRTGNQLTVPMYDIPGGTAPYGTATPQGVFKKLKTMQQQGDSESPNITIPGVKGFAGNSNGPCN